MLFAIHNSMLETSCVSNLFKNFKVDYETQTNDEINLYLLMSDVLVVSLTCHSLSELVLICVSYRNNPRSWL